MDVCSYLSRCYGKQAGEAYLKILNSPFDYQQFEEDNKDVAKLIELFDEIDKVGMINNEKYYEWEGLNLSTSQWADFLNIQPNSFRCRINRYGLSKKTFETNTKESLLTWQGETKTYKEWSEKLKISYNAFKCRLSKHGLTNAVFSVNTRELKKQYIFGNESKTIEEWAKKLNISYSSFYRRIKILGQSNPATYQPRKEKTNKKNQQLQKSGPKEQKYTWENNTLTAQEWAVKLGISKDTFKKRIKRYGKENPLTYSLNLVKKKTI